MAEAGPLAEKIAKDVHESVIFYANSMSEPYLKRNLLLTEQYTNALIEIIHKSIIKIF